MNSKDFIQAIKNGGVLVNRNGETIEKKIYKQKTGSGFIFNDFTIGFFICFDDVKEYGKGGEIAIYNKDIICGIMRPDSWVIA